MRLLHVDSITTKRSSDDEMARALLGVSVLEMHSGLVCGIAGHLRTALDCKFVRWLERYSQPTSEAPQAIYNSPG